MARLLFVSRNDRGTRLTDAAPEHSTEANQGMAAAHRANVARTVADHLTVSAQHRAEKVDRIQDRLGFWSGIHDSRWIHHSRLWSHGKVGFCGGKQESNRRTGRAEIQQGTNRRGET